MGKYLKAFDTNIDYSNWENSEEWITPNVALIKDSNDVMFNSYIPPVSDPFNGHEYVDLGLPSGTLWAKCNVGAEKESDYGLYFQWGDVVGYSSDQVGSGEGKKYFKWSDYKYCNGSNTTLTKYNTKSSSGIVDNLTTPLPEDDAASVNMGGSWHIPSIEQIDELYNSSYTTTTWTTVNGIYGRLITSNTNGNTLFLPASGSCNGDSVSDVGSIGCYWSSSLDTDYPGCAWHLLFRSSAIYDNSSYRYNGTSVRGVVG